MRTSDPARDDNPPLGSQPVLLIDHGGPFLNQTTAHAMERLSILAFYRRKGNEAPMQVRLRFIACLRIGLFPLGYGFAHGELSSVTGQPQV